MNSLKTFFLSAISSGILLSASTMWATASAAPVAPIQRAVADFLDAQNKGLPGQASYSIGAINAAGLPDDCRNLTVTMDANARPWGKTHVNVRCTEGSPWSLYVPVDIHVLVNYVVSARPLTAGQIISTTDIRQRQGDLADLPQGTLTDLTQAVGQISRVSLPADRPLRADMLRQPLVVKQGQNVKVVSGGIGFQVSSDGRALNNAATGEVVQVRLASGQVLSGIAQKDGTIAIAY